MATSINIKHCRSSSAHYPYKNIEKLHWRPIHWCGLYKQTWLDEFTTAMGGSKWNCPQTRLQNIETWVPSEQARSWDVYMPTSTNVYLCLRQKSVLHAASKLW